MKYAWPAGSTSKTVLLFIQDSASTTGAGKTGLSVGAIATQQIRVQSNNTVTIATVSTTNLVALTDAYTSGGWFEIGALTAPGWYRFDIPNDVLSTGAVTAGISIIGSVSASNVAQLALEIQLQNVPADVVAKAGVTVSVSTLYPVLVRQWDTVSVSASNVAVTDFTTRLNANTQQWAGTSVTTGSIVTWQTISQANVTQWAGSAASTSDVAILDTTDSRLNVNVAQWQGISVTTANVATWQTISTANVTAWAGGLVSASDVAVADFSDRLNVNVQQWSGKSVSTSDYAAFSVSQTVVAPAAAGTNVTQWGGVTVSASNVAIQKPGSLADSILTRTLTETYAADGAAFTPGQFMYQSWARWSEFSISSQIISAFRLDGTTLAMTFSLDSATAPTKVERIS